MMPKRLNQLKNKVLSLRQSSLAKDSFWMLASRGLKIFIQAAYFIILARTLGPKEYGVFVGIAALATMVNSFAGWGSSQILVKHVANNRSLLRFYWGNALATVFFMGTVLTCLFSFLGPIFSRGNFSPAVIALIFIADLIGFNINQISSSAFIASGKAKIAAFKSILEGITKLVAAGILAWLLTDASATQWAFLYCASTVLPAIAAIIMVNTWLDKPRFSLPRLKKEFLQGFYFSISQSSDFINENIDKTMLASISSLQATGVYGAGFRLVTVFNIPILSVAGASFPRFFQHGTKGIKGTFAFAKTLMPTALFYGLVSAVVLIAISPYVKNVLGDDYAEIAILLRIIAFLPLITAFQVLGGDALTGANFQSFRSTIQVSAAVINIALNIWLIPLYSWHGAAWATMLSESAKVMGFFAVIFYLLNQNTKVPSKSSEGIE